jgi:hypothetical protein
MGAGCYLSPDVYTKPAERRCAWQIALLHAANEGKFEEMKQLLELLDADGVTCEGLLVRLQQRFMPSVELELRKAMQQFVAFTRGKRSLLQAVKDLKVLLLECQKRGYRPDSMTLTLKFESLLPQSDMPIFRLYQDREARRDSLSRPGTASSASSTSSAPRVSLETTNSPTEKDAEDGTVRDDNEFDVFMRALEALARDQEEQKGKVDGGKQDLPFGGGAFDGQREKDGRRPGRKPKRSGYRGGDRGDGKDAKDSKSCPNCGRRCDAMKGKGKDKCPAVDKECHKCGQKGHFGFVCRGGKRKENDKPSGKHAGEPSKAGVGFGGFGDGSDEFFH